MGRGVQCPACGQRYTITVATLVQDVAPEPPSTEPSYELAERAVVPTRPTRTAPISSVVEDEDDSLPPAVKLGLAIGVGVSALVVCVLTFVFYGILAPGETSQPPDNAGLASIENAVAAPSAFEPHPTGTDSLSSPPSANEPPPPVVASNPTQSPPNDPSPSTSSIPLPAPTPDTSERKPMSTADIVAESEPSIALVKGKSSSGTGFLVGPGLLATNSHVIDDEFINTLEIRFPSADDAHKGPLPAELLFEDTRRDLAFLRVNTDLKPLRVAASYQFRKGEEVTIIGNPGIGDGMVLENAVSRGVMSTRTDLNGQPFYQLGAAVNPGNSGGPAFDSTGRVIGVVTLKTNNQEAVTFCVPVEDLQAALASMANQKPQEVERARSKHRILNAVKGLGGAGAIYAVGIDLRRAAAAGASSNPEFKTAYDKIEALITEMNKEIFPTLLPEIPAIVHDPMVAKGVAAKVDLFAMNYKKLKTTYEQRASGTSVDDLRRMKQTHKQLINELSAALKLDPPKEMMVAFEDRGANDASSQPALVIRGFGPPSAGSLRERLYERHGLRPPGSSLSPRSRLSPSSPLRRRGLR